ncbi:MAG: hypothetical protein V4684_06890 [Pseudomonadota bacterium]
MLGIQSDRIKKLVQIELNQASACSDSQTTHPAVERQLSFDVPAAGPANLDLPSEGLQLLSLTAPRGQHFTNIAPAPVLNALLQYTGNDDLRAIAGDPDLTEGMAHIPAFRAVAHAVTGLHNATHELEAAQLEREEDPVNLHAFENPRLLNAYNQMVATTYSISPATKSAVVNGISVLTLGAAAGFTYAAANPPPEDNPAWWGVIAGVNWFNAGMINLAACTYRRKATAQRDLDMRTAVTIDLNRLGTNIDAANTLVEITLDDFRAMDRNQQPDNLMNALDETPFASHSATDARAIAISIKEDESDNSADRR